MFSHPVLAQQALTPIRRLNDHLALTFYPFNRVIKMVKHVMCFQFSIQNNYFALFVWLSSAHDDSLSIGGCTSRRKREEKKQKKHKRLSCYVNIMAVFQKLNAVFFVCFKF